nr:unnamed protein product [Callosobruchus analis]
MMATRKPDWKCVFTYVQSIYRRFKDKKSERLVLKKHFCTQFAFVWKYRHSRLYR